MNFLRNILGSGSKQELAVIPSGQLFLKRSPHSVKGVSECIYKEAAAIIRKTEVEFQSQLIVQRVYEEGEEAFEGTEEEDQLDDEEWCYLIDEALRISYFMQDGHVVVTWNDLNGDPGDRFEFICDTSIKPEVYDKFSKVAQECMYERKYTASAKGVSEDDLNEFDYPPPVTEVEANESTAVDESVAADFNEVYKRVANDTEGIFVKEEEEGKKENKAHASVPTAAPETVAAAVAAPASAPVVQDLPQFDALLGENNAELHLFDAGTGAFELQAASTTVRIEEVAKQWEYWLTVTNGTKPVLGMPITSEMNPCFNYEHLSFIFNYFAPTGAGFSWLLKFGSFEELEIFQQVFMQALWQRLHRQKYTTAPETEKDYLSEAFGAMDIDDEGTTGLEDLPEEDEDEDEFEDCPQGPARDFSDDEEYDNDEVFGKNDDLDKNKLLAVGTSNDRSYVVRGNRIGVFKNTADNELEFATTIENISKPDKTSFNPDKMMLHYQDKHIVLQDKSEGNNLYKMDLEYGKVVDEWKVSDDSKNGVVSFAPSAKFAQMTGEQTFLGMANSGLFRIDPRLSGSKLVDSEHKKYATNNQFSALTSTEGGHIAVASQKGEIRLFDRLGINAKTALPALGDPILGVDVSADGRWILATCKTYILLIDATIKDGKYEGETGFKRSFAKDAKPRPKRLQISPEHVAFMLAETGSGLNFTKAHFNQGPNSREQTVVTSSGPYVVTWSLKKLLRGDANPYLIKRYSDQVTAGDFRFGTDKNVIVATEDDVNMVSKKSFRKPTRESLATPGMRRGTLGRSSIVNELY
ncbi:VID27 cytoplasmic protein-domain-containing protein [Yarrowia lipolytica]|nr:Vacuolar import and degradation protein 27 [Yarrowia lipolytica]RDW29845.1 VID27 cytoplasmic protein-domain-containing protein [Yarrowia lipolytica]SEI35435.1 YALIA101S07e01046g1_1 [Yarrowia lipolytica]